MKNGSKWNYAAATMKAASDAGIGACKITGIVTAATAAAVITDVHAWTLDAGAVGLLADYRDAALLLDEDLLMEAARQAMRTRQDILRPTALVVQQDHLAMFQRYTWLAAQHGICRAVFIDAERARQWTQVQAQVFAQWPVMRRPASAESSRTGSAFVPALARSSRA